MNDMVVSRIVPKYFQDGSFAFGQYLIPKEGPTSYFQYCTSLSSTDCVFTRCLRVEKLRDCFTKIPSMNEDWKEFADNSLGTDSFAYKLRVKRMMKIDPKTVTI